MNRSKQAVMAIKTMIALLVGVALAFVHLAEAQQAGKRIGYLGCVTTLTGAARHSGRDCVSLATSKGKTLSLSGDIMRKETRSPPRARG